MSERPRLASVEGLARIPGPPTRPPSIPRAEPTTELQGAGSEVEAPGDPAPAGQPRSATKRPKASDTATTWRDISFTTPAELRDLLRAAARQNPDKTRAAVVLEAIEATHSRLSGLVDAEKTDSGGGGGLFPDPVQIERRSRETRVAETLRVTESNLKVLDRLVLEHRAENRSQLLTAALRDHFQGRDLTH